MSKPGDARRGAQCGGCSRESTRGARRAERTRRELLSLGLPDSRDHRARPDDVARDLAGLVAFGERYAAEMRFDRGPKLQETAVILAWRRLPLWSETASRRRRH